MNTNEFLDQLKHEDIVTAIREAEGRTSGEIRVFVTRKTVNDPVSVAQGEFVRMGMEKTRERNGVLIFVAPRTNKFAVIGDAGVHEKCGEAFWKELTATMSGHFRETDFTRGLIHGIKKAGDLLAQHFPRRPDDVNELPDEVEHD
jgi:uncharacterized membrane protein